MAVVKTIDVKIEATEESRRKVAEAVQKVLDKYYKFPKTQTNSQ